MFHNYEEKTVTKQTMFHGGIINVESQTVELVNGKRATRDIVRHPGAVAVLAVKEDKLLLVRQYRKPLDAHTFEIPAGKLDGPDEIPFEAIKRELEEETDYAAKNWTKVVSFHTTPGFCDEIIHLYYATGLVELQHARPADEDEFLDITWMEFDRVQDLIKMGLITDIKTLYAISYWETLRLKEQLRGE